MRRCSIRIGPHSLPSIRAAQYNLFNRQQIGGAVKKRRFGVNFGFIAFFWVREATMEEMWRSDARIARSTHSFEETQRRLTHQMEKLSRICSYVTFPRVCTAS